MKGLGVSDDLRRFVHTDVEGRVTAFLSKDDVLKQGSWGREQALLLASELCEAETNGNILLSDVFFTAKLIRDLLQKDDLGAMGAALEKFQAVEEDQILEDGVIQFLQSHKIGMALIANCSERLEAGQAQLQEELFVNNLEQAVTEVRRAEGEMTASAVSDVAIAFWKLKSSKPEGKLMSKHKLSVQMMTQEFWMVMSRGIRNMLTSTLTSCFEVILDQGLEKSFDLQEILVSMKSSELVQHHFWTDIGKSLPQSLKKELDRYAAACETVSALFDFVIAKKTNRAPAKEPTSDDLKQWSSCDVEVCAFLDDAAIMEGFKNHFVFVASKELQAKAMAAFRHVGEMVEACLGAVSDLAEMALQLSHVKDGSVLGKAGLWGLVLPAFVQAGKRGESIVAGHFSALSVGIQLF